MHAIFYHVVQDANIGQLPVMGRVSVRCHVVMIANAINAASCYHVLMAANANNYLAAYHAVMTRFASVANA